MYGYITTCSNVLMTASLRLKQLQDLVVSSPRKKLKNTQNSALTQSFIIYYKILVVVWRKKRMKTQSAAVAEENEKTTYDEERERRQRERVDTGLEFTSMFHLQILTRGFFAVSNLTSVYPGNNILNIFLLSWFVFTHVFTSSTAN